MPRQLNARLLHHKMEKLREKGKDGEYVSDGTVRGLKYEKQGDGIYARLRVMNKATGKRDNHPYGALPTLRELTRRSVASGQSLAHVTETALEEFRARARRDRLNAREGIVSAEPVKGKTVAQLWTQYERIELTKLREKSVNSARSYAKRFILPQLGARHVASVTRQDIEELHASFHKTPYQANRVLSQPSVLFGKAVEWEWRGDNPARRTKRFAEHGREEWYTPEELAKLVTALEAIAAGDNEAAKVSARAILLTLYTGARPSEVRDATWEMFEEMFDLERGTWTKPGSQVKQKKVHHLALNEDSVELLRAIRAKAEGNGYVFPSPFVPGKPLKDVGRTWERVVKVAGVRRLPLYSLRHSVGSVLANAGVDLYTIGKQLGHAQAKTTARYAHLAVETQRQAAARFGELFKSNGKPPMNRDGGRIGPWV